MIDIIKEKMPQEEDVVALSELFKVLGDYTRTRILAVLEMQELCVNDIALCLDMSISAVSHQLRILRQTKLVKSNKKGKEVIYSFDDDHVSKIYKCALEHIKE